MNSTIDFGAKASAQTTEYLLEDDLEVLLRKAAHNAGIGLESDVLNIACEFHRAPKWLEGRVSADRVSGVEINRELVEKDPLIKYCDVDADTFPFADSTFDAELSVFGVEHFKTANVFHEVHRTLKPGGSFIFLVPNLLYPAFLVNKILGERFANFYYRRIMRASYEPHEAHYRFNTLRAIRRVARDAGFSSVSLTFFGPSNMLLYTRRLPWAQAMVRALERALNNRVLYRFKPYIIAVLVR